jgi:hypothetical protein
MPSGSTQTLADHGVLEHPGRTDAFVGALPLNFYEGDCVMNEPTTNLLPVSDPSPARAD